MLITFICPKMIAKPKGHQQEDREQAEAREALHHEDVSQLLKRRCQDRTQIHRDGRSGCRSMTPDERPGATASPDCVNSSRLIDGARNFAGEADDYARRPIGASTQLLFSLVQSSAASRPRPNECTGLRSSRVEPRRLDQTDIEGIPDSANDQSFESTYW